MGWTLRALCDAAGLGAEPSADTAVDGLAYDSRTVRPGDLFCCIPGGRSDGHEHAAAAVDAGAVALLVERDVPVAVPVARVPVVRHALGPLADAFFGRPSAAMAVCGVTGTNGKTTVTYLLEAMARAAGRSPGVLGTVEWRVGERAVPAQRTTPEAVDLQRTLAEMREAGADLVAMEVTSHGLHQRRVAGTRFACAAFTNLTQDHLDYHGTLEDYFDAKALLFDRGYTDRAVINTADAWGRRLAGRVRGLDVLTYAGPDADLSAGDVRMDASGTRLTLRSPDGSADVRTPLAGRYNVDNLLCAAGMALQAGLPLEAVVAGAAALQAVPGRLERVDAGQPFAVLVDYAHTPDALARALEACRELCRGRLIAVFGCGGDRDRAKRPLMGEAAARLADLAIVTSDNPRSEDPLAIIEEILAGVMRVGGDHRVEPDRRQAIAEALAEAGPGDLVLVAGKGHESGQTFADHTIPFDDRQVVRELLAGAGARGA